MSEEASPEDDSYIVRVKAVVMSRDDSSGGWIPHEGGGLSRVGVSKVYPDGSGRNEFIIHGERLKDKLVILECYLRKDLVYWKATPTFHHWLVDNRRFGLTFQSPADARAFDRGVRKAIEDLTEGSTTSSSTIHNEAELGDDDVFALPHTEPKSQFLRLYVTAPCQPATANRGYFHAFEPIMAALAGSQQKQRVLFRMTTNTGTDSSSNSSQKREPPVRTIASPLPGGLCQYSPLSPIDPYSLELYTSEQSISRPPRHVSFPDDDDEIVRINPRERIWLTGYEDYRQAPIYRKCTDSENVDSYVHFAKSNSSKHDYNYPYIDHSDFGVCKDIKGSVINTQPTRCKPRRKDGERSRCVYCREMFNHDENGRGQCQDAPDSVRNCIRRVSCMGFADCVLYHCMSDSEGDYTDACSCDTSDEKFCLRWMLLIPLSIIAPGMCCYLPLRACYNCGVVCGCCGGKHKAVA